MFDYCIAFRMTYYRFISTLLIPLTALMYKQMLMFMSTSFMHKISFSKHQFPTNVRILFSAVVIFLKVSNS
jgi:hypothetical protein